MWMGVCAVVLSGKEVAAGLMTSVPVSVEQLGEQGSSGLDLTFPRGVFGTPAKRRAPPCLAAGPAKGQKPSFPQDVPPPSAPP